MGRTLRLSDNLVREARKAASLERRAVGAQVELWARLGRAVEPVLLGRQVLEILQRDSAALDAGSGMRRRRG